MHVLTSDTQLVRGWHVLIEDLHPKTDKSCPATLDYLVNTNRTLNHARIIDRTHKYTFIYTHTHTHALAQEG